MSLSRILNDSPTPTPPNLPSSISANSLSRLLNDDPPHPPPSITSPTRPLLFHDRSPRSPLDSLSLDASNLRRTSLGFVSSPPIPRSSEHWDSYHVSSPKIEPTPPESSSYNPDPSIINEDSSMTSSKSRKKRRTNEQLNSLDQPRRMTRHSAKVMIQESNANLSSLPSDQEPGLSSDLEGCPELWQDELGKYIMNTHRRERGIENWFDSQTLSQSTTTVHQRTEQYTQALQNIAAFLQTRKQLPSPSDEEMCDFPSSSRLQPPPERTSHFPNEAGGMAQPELASGSDAESDFEIPIRESHQSSSRHRKYDDMDDITDEVERSVADDNSRAATPLTSTKGVKRSRARLGDELHLPAKKKAKKRKLQEDTSVHDSGTPTPYFAPSALGNLGSEAGTPAPSVPSSPNMKTIYELSDAIPPLRRPTRRLDGSQALKRIKAVEDAQLKVWQNIARREIPKVYKFHMAAVTGKAAQRRRLAQLCSTQARKPHGKTTKVLKEASVKAKKVMKDMLLLWRRNEREERDGRKRAEKEAVDRAKEEEERREAARQARKLEFLITQTELYSHFVGSKLRTAETEQQDANDTATNKSLVEDSSASAEEASSTGPLADIDFDDEDETNLRSHARRNAQDAVDAARKQAHLFDAQTALDRKTNEALALAKGQAHVHDGGKEVSIPATTLMDLDSEELNFQNPSSLSGPLTISQPQMLKAQLKEYQLKGLNWLATLYEQGINGILADEMGLGKTVQSISLLAYLAETHDIWGPFLVIAPASTLHNWQQEITRFAPDIKALPYWGNVKDRATLRKFWNRKQISYNRDAPFHVLITSYQLVLADEKYFQRVKWQYMILDEAQNIKNSSSARWKTLLSFHCRNRLLLTGTPIQNSMHELWALLHFIMPTLFDSHDEFSEWFSKDIESAAAEHKGSKFNEHQLKRLHMILKPFMLRRVKKHVQNELSEKIEVDLFCDLSFRQRALYRALRANVSVKELLEKAANVGDADSTRTLMNLVMQFRKVCNHPELFERADVQAPFSFCHFGDYGSIHREGDILNLPYSTRNAIDYPIPTLLYTHGGFLDVPSEESAAGFRNKWLMTHLNIWSTDWISRSLHGGSASFSFVTFLDTFASQLQGWHRSSLFERLAIDAYDAIKQREAAEFLFDDEFCISCIRPIGLIGRPTVFLGRRGLTSLDYIRASSWAKSCLSRPFLQWRVPPVVAPPIQFLCRMRSFVDQLGQMKVNKVDQLALFGLPVSLWGSMPHSMKYHELLPGLPLVGLFRASPKYQLPAATMQVPDAKRLIYDSAKLARLDALLQELKAGDHRVLIYFQMTKMMDLMEEYLIFRQYKYLRLDGSSKLEDRRDMVMDWQTRPDIFVFILSTRAGGLGINLTAADTVVFYDNDWNPSNDSQAMDRAHRLGQTRQVTVYRLITRGTIDERIIQLARVKKDVQDIVVGNKQIADVAPRPSEIVSLLLNDEDLANLGDSGSSISQLRTSDTRHVAEQASLAAKDMWDEEGDNYFNAGSLPAPISDLDPLEPTAPGKRNGQQKVPAKRGRKPGTGKGIPRKKKTDVGDS